MNISDQETLIAALQNTTLYDYPVDEFQIIETHISWVLLTGPYAYKFKKALDLGFLDYSTLEKRRLNCEEELRLNRRTAPKLYLEVMAIGGSARSPVIDGDGPAIEYAVKMKQFPQTAMLEQQLTDSKLSAQQVSSLAKTLADFHQRIDIAEIDSPYGEPEVIYQPIQENFTHIKKANDAADVISILERHSRWCDAQFQKLKPVFQQRKQSGFIRECHGDLHLGNLILLNDHITLFDCIEFNPNLRWIDVISELAFLVMDLQDRGHDEYAQRVLNSYLEYSGDYAGLKLLRFYQHYRAMVRAKVCCIRLEQADLCIQEREQQQARFAEYLNLAEDYTQAQTPYLMINHGLSGSGKTTISQHILEANAAIRIRSDVERKRLFGLMPEQGSDSAVDAGIYTQQGSERTYQRLEALAETIIQAGFSVIVDATFLKQKQRNTFRTLARKLDVAFIILDYQADEQTLHERIEGRKHEGIDASEADPQVLAHQLESMQALGKMERAVTVSINTQQILNVENILVQIEKIKQHG